MRWLERARMRLRMFLHRRREKERLDDELGFHLEQQVAENIAAGMSPGDARYVALRMFGNPLLLRERARDTWSWNWVDLVLQNMRIGIRTLARTPGFAFISILVIAIGIGANVSLFTVVRSVLLKPLPYRDPARLVRLCESSPDNKFPCNTVAGGVFTEWKKQTTGFSELAILLTWPSYNLSGAGGQIPEKVRASMCSWDLFPTLGIEPILGRNFTAEDDQSGAPATVILSWGLWKRRFGGDPAILNQTIHLDARSYTVIGVMPSRFAYPDQSVQMWTPIYHDQPAARMQSLDAHMFVAVGRLKPRTTPDQAVAEMSLIVRRLHDQHLDDPFVSKTANIRPLLDDMVGDIKAPLYTLLVATGCVLLIACLNVANLLVARGATRRREIAIRTALGSSRLRLLGQQLTESLILSATGGALGLGLAYAVIQWLVSTRQDLSRAESVHIDGVVVVFTLGLVLLCAVFAGSISSVSISGHNVISSLRESSRSYSGGHAQAKLRKLLLSLEVGLTAILLITAGLLLKSYERLRSTNLGCVTNNVLTMGFALPETQYSEPSQRVSFFETLLERVRSLPGIQAAGLATSVPGQGYYQDNGFAIEEHPPLAVGQLQYALDRWVDPGFFAALGIPILRGETFDRSQRLDQATKVVVSDSFVRQYLSGENPLGKHLLTLGHKSYEIIGVVGDTRYLVGQPAQPIMYFPLYGGSESYGALVVRASGDVSRFALPIQGIVQELDRDLPVSDILTMDQLIGKSTVDASFDATLVSAFACLSLILAAVGLFGVLSHIVAQRTTEIGIRIALGAQRESVLRLVLFDGLRPAFVGLALGVAGSIAAGQLIQSLLYGTSAFDFPVFATVVAALLLVAAAACAIPAWRVSRLDPMTALRAE